MYTVREEGSMEVKAVDPDVIGACCHAPSITFSSKFPHGNTVRTRSLEVFQCDIMTTNQGSIDIVAMLKSYSLPSPEYHLTSHQSA